MNINSTAVNKMLGNNKIERNYWRINFIILLTKENVYIFTPVHEKKKI